MADRVAEIERLPEPSLALVGIDDVSLDLDVACDDGRKLVHVVFGIIDGSGLKLREKLGVREHAMLDDLAAGVREQLVADG